MKCPDCGVPLDEIPFKKCAYHKAYAADEERALQAKLASRPWSQKIEESENFEELKQHLTDWFREQE